METNDGAGDEPGVRKENLDIVAELSYNIAQCINDKIVTLTYNEAAFALMFQLCNVISQYLHNMTNEEVSPQHIYHLINSTLSYMYRENMFEVLGNKIHNLIGVDELLKDIFKNKTIERKHDDNNI